MQARKFHSIPPCVVALGSALCAGSLLAQAPLPATHACAATKTDCRQGQQAQMHDESNTITELRIAGQLKKIQVQPQGLGANFPAYEVNPRGPLGLASEPDPNGNAGVGRRIWSIFRF